MEQTQQNQQVQQQQNKFDPSQVKRSYFPSEWTMKEEWYINSINAISVPANPMPSDVANMACQVEKMLSTARLDMAFIEQAYNRWNMQCKVQESILFTGLKAIQQGGKLTIDEKKSRITEYLNATPWNGGKLTLYELREGADMRYVFMKNIIQSLMDKKDLLITHSSAIKADATLNALSPSVPQV